MGIECKELTLNDIEVGIDNSGGTPKVNNLICKNLNTPRIIPSEGVVPAPTSEMDRLPKYCRGITPRTYIFNR